MAWGLLVAFLLPSFPETVARDGSAFFKHEDERRLILQRTIAGSSTNFCYHSMFLTVN
jgi:hypothetical protein